MLEKVSKQYQRKQQVESRIPLLVLVLLLQLLPLSKERSEFSLGISHFSLQIGPKPVLWLVADFNTLYVVSQIPLGSTVSLLDEQWVP